MDNTLLNKFYDDHVKMIKNETSQNIEIVIPIVKDILQYVHTKDRRFKSQPINVGSYYTHLKVSRADEFDFSVVLDTPQLDWCRDDSDHKYGFDKKNEIVRKQLTLPDPPIGKGFISPTGTIRKWNREGINGGPACLTIDDDIIPIFVKSRFKSLVGRAVEDQPNIRKYVNAKRLSESPATTLTITHPQIAGDSVSVDLTPMIESSSRFRKTFGWPRPTSQWPSEKKVEKLRSIGVNDIAKDAFYWTYSFASCEKELLEGIDTKETCRKKSQKIMKKLKESWCPEGIRKGLTSYHLNYTPALLLYFKVSIFETRVN
ncbi:protein mab-21-like 3 [Mytilus trossulus]|uniref:protein mab-21-like 3 n=1 Tax=Mytilus trossulus TaxID=6551 RepID=UPI003005A56C